MKTASGHSRRGGSRRDGKIGNEFGINLAPLIARVTEIQAAARKAVFEEEEAERLRVRIKKFFGDIRRLCFEGATEAAEEILPNRRPSTIQSHERLTCSRRPWPGASPGAWSAASPERILFTGSVRVRGQCGAKDGFTLVATAENLGEPAKFFQPRENRKCLRERAFPQGQSVVRGAGNTLFVFRNGPKMASDATSSNDNGSGKSIRSGKAFLPLWSGMAVAKAEQRRTRAKSRRTTSFWLPGRNSDTRHPTQPPVR